MTTPDTQKNYAPAWKKFAVAGAVAATITGLMVSQNMTQVKASHTSEYISVDEFAAGETHATILSTDGKAYSRGWNNTGQLGVQAGSTVNVADWTEISAPEKLVKVEASDHTVALTESGKLYSWGPNMHGQIGNGNSTAAFIPTQITAVDRFSKIASGNAFTLALDAEGRLWSWGANNAGQLGDGTTTDRSVPKLVGGTQVFKEIYAAKDTAYAIDNSGNLWAWGANNDGQIGDNTTKNRNKPALVETNHTWSRLAVNLENNTVLGIDSSGWLYSWGANANGLLGNGTDWRKLQEVENARFKAMIEQIEAGDAQRKLNLINQCVEDAYQAAYADYEAEYEKVSKERDAAEKAAEEEKKKKEAAEKAAKEEETKKNSPTPSASPSATDSPSDNEPSPSPSASPSVSPMPIPNPDALDEPVREDFVEKCTTDVEKTFAKTDTSGMKAGVIKEPALKESHKRPQRVTSDYQVKDIALGSENAYVVDALNRLHSWGKDANGQTGLGLEDAKSLTQVPVVIKEGVKDVDAGSKYGVAVSINGDMLVWGANNSGVLMSNPISETKLTKPTVKGSGYTAVTAGLTTVYGFKNQTAYVWGNNANGELGIGSTEGSIYAPTELDRKVLSIAPAGKGAVALGTINQLLYWGTNQNGQFGNNTTSNNAERKISSNEITTFTAVSAGADYTTAIASDGRLWGWGSNSKNLLDLSGSIKDKLYPVALSTGMTKVTAVASGENVNAMTDGSVLTVWTGGVSHTYELADIVELAAGDNHVVARTKDGKVWNWSVNETGIREGTKAMTLAQVDTRSYKSVSAGGSVSGAITENGEAVLWGTNSEKLRLAGKEGDPVKNFTFAKLSIGDGYVLASDENNVLWGWGESRYLVLGSQSVNEFPAVLTSQKEETNAAKEVK